MKPLIFLSCLLLSLPLWAQYQERALVSASGFQGEAAGYFVEYSLGELAIGTFSAGGYTALLGFHQPPLDPSTDIPLLNGAIQVKAFPNPTRSWVNVQVSENGKDQIRHLSLIDMRGITVMHFNGQELTSNPYQISMRDLHPGMYFMRVVFADGTWEVIKVSLIK
ncbi:MAG: T9SS type A sorting domain-containing protein [Bacteroides sp.]|jgi:hypothetical protein|nr:T9SS type A sorting domain-containing protein [Bacteroides sp.]